MEDQQDVEGEGYGALKGRRLVALRTDTCSRWVASSTPTSSLTWIAWFCSLPGHEYFCEVSEDFIEDDFNLTGLASLVPFWKEAMEMVLDVEPGATRHSAGCKRLGLTKMYHRGFTQDTRRYDCGILSGATLWTGASTLYPYASWTAGNGTLLHAGSSLRFLTRR